MWDEELDLARVTDNFAVQTNIELIFVDANMDVTIVDGEGNACTLASKFKEGHIMPVNALLIRDQLGSIDHNL